MSDYAGALSSAAKQRLTDQLLSYEQGTTRQIAVALFRSLEGESLEEVSIRLASQWGIGGKRSQDGVLLTLFLADHKMRIEVGYGLEDKLTDAGSARILRDVIAPRLRAGDLEGGLRAGIAAIDTAVSGRAHPEGEVAAGSRRGRAPGRNGAGGLLVLVVLAVIVVIIIFQGGGRGGRRRGGGWFPFFWGGGWGGGGGWSSGGGGWSSGGSSGGGWSGGGGSFGGGGASGSW